MRQRAAHRQITTTRKRSWIAVLLAAASLGLCLASPLHAQTGTLIVQVVSRGAPVGGAAVTIGDRTEAAGATDGVTRFSLAPGAFQVIVTGDGFLPATVPVNVRADVEQRLIVELQPQPLVEEEVTVVAATRTGRRLEDEPTRVEVLGREEIEEKLMMTPGDIVMMLNEMGGMRVQATSPSLGAAGVRVQGMRGRYTRVFSDGLPLHGDVGGLGLLQIPPMDLAQVEVIKGVASALYGAGAMGGVINLLSRRPGDEPEYEGLLNRSSRGGTDGVAFLSSPLAGRWSGSLLAGGHWHDIAGVDGDEWADLPGYERAIVRPRVFWDDGVGRMFFGTAGITVEDRRGGTLDGRVLEVTGRPWREALDTRRYDAGGVGQLLAGDAIVVTVRAALSRQRHTHAFGDVVERDRHDTAFGELAVRGGVGRQTWVGGMAIEHAAYASADVPRFDYAFTVPGAFLQYEVDVAPRLSISTSARLDAHSEYGTFLSPRVSALTRAGGWTSRVSVGTGFFAASPLTEETEAAGLSRLSIDGPLVAERGLSASFDLSRTVGPWSATATIFAFRIADPVHVDRSGGLVLRNLADPATAAGVEVLGTFRRAPFALTATYTAVRARERPGGVRQEVPLTPAHSAGIVGMWEEEDAGRIGVEWYFTGRQRLEENPFRPRSAAYSVVGVLAERRFGRVRLFANGENLTDARQTRWDPLIRPAQAADGRWTVDAWAPLEGRNVNGGVRVEW